MLTRIMVVVAGLGLSAGAQGELKTFNQTSGDFEEPTFWTPNGVPDADDRIIIPAGKLCNVNANAAVDTIEILTDGTDGDGNLTIKSGVTLTLDNDNHNCPSPGPGCPAAPQHSIIDGQLDLVGDPNSGDAVLEITNATHEFTGDGRIFGNFGDDSRIVIATDLKLINKMATIGGGIRGGLTVVGQTGGTNRGILRNEGIVSTDAAQVTGTANDNVIIDANIEDNSSAVWVTDCTGTMEFKHGNTDMKGLFTDRYSGYGFIGFGIDGGTFKFNATVRTCGTYEREGCGGLTFLNNAEFKYASFSGSCTNPDTNGTSSDTPNNCSGTDQFFIVNTNEAADCE